MWQTAVAELDTARGGALLAATLFHEDLDGHLRSSLSEPRSLLVVGLIDEVVVGFALASVANHRGEAIGTVELIYVDPDARAVGVGEEMLGVLLSWCESSGCVGLD